MSRRTLGGFNSISKIRKQTKKVSKRNIALPHRAVGNDKNKGKKSFFKEAETIIPQGKKQLLAQA